MPTKDEMDEMFAGTTISSEEIKAAQEQMKEAGSPFAILAALVGVKYCPPPCYGILQFGDGGSSPPVYCTRCGTGYDEIPPQKGGKDAGEAHEDGLSSEV